MRPSSTIPRPILLALAASAVTIFLATLVLLDVEKPISEAAPSFSAVTLGGIEYQAMDGRPIHPSDPVDRRMIAGLAARDLRTRRSQILFGAFVSFTNHSPRPLRSARRIELRDGQGHVYRPRPLRASNPYAYSARVVRPRATVPAQGTPADDNLAATGLLLVYRIPAAEYDNGTLELVIHSPLRPRDPVSLII